MIEQDYLVGLVEVAGATPIPGLVFRRFRGEADYPLIVELTTACSKADGDDWFPSLDDIRAQYAHPVNFDPYTDMIFAEIDGALVAFSRCQWRQIEAGPRVYTHWGRMHPAWRRNGIGQAMLRYNEAHLRQLAASQAAPGEKFLQSFGEDIEPGSSALLINEGYTAVRYSFEMLRDLAEPIEDVPLPAGIEARSGQPAEYRAIWEADAEAFRDHWGYSAPTEADYQSWIAGPWFQPQLWQIGWAGDQVAGMVLNFILHESNKVRGVERGYTEGISVRRPWRRMGLARALLTRSLQMFREMGMTEAALGVDADNPNGALQLYEGVGFKVIRRATTYRKPLD